MSSKIFSLFAHLRRFSYRVRSVYKSKFIIVSVGNVTVGGTGKTPFVDMLCKKLMSRKIAVLSRGYGRLTKGFYEVDVQNPQAPLLFGDEPVMLAERNPNVPVFVCENRVVALQHIEKKYPDLEIIILDDSLQNFSIHKDFEYVVIDATEELKNYKILPLGRARMSLDWIHDRHIIVFTKTDIVKMNESLQNRFKKNKKIITKYSDLVIPLTQKDERENILLLSGIGKPKNFESLMSRHISFREHFIFPDHYSYKKEDFDFMRDFKNHIIMTTEKDFVKLKRLGLEFKIVPIKVDFEVLSGSEYIDSISSKNI